MLGPAKLIVVCAVLFLVCTVYAIVLDKHPQWYIPDGTIWTVVIGDGLIFVALWVLELWGVPLTAAIVLVALFVGGFPIGVWQAIQRARNNGRRQGRRRDE